MAPDLSALLAVLSGAGSLVGATVGFAWKAETDRRLVENIALGGACGALVGTLLAFVMKLAATAAGA